MMVLKQGRVVTEIGSKELVHSFFSTIVVRLEQGKFGSRFPTIMNEFCNKGTITHEQCQAALKEMQIIRDELSKFKPAQVVYDYKDVNAPPAPNVVGLPLHLGTLATCHTTKAGRSLVEEILDNLGSQREFGGLLQILSN